MMIITMRVDFDASWRAGYGTCMRMMIIWCWRWRRCPRGKTRSDTLVKVAPPGPRQWAIVPTWDTVSCVSAKILHDKPKTGHLNTTIKSPYLSSHKYAPFNFRMFHFGSVSSLSNSLAKKITCFWILPGTSTETFKIVCQLKMDQQHTLWSCWCSSGVALNYFFGMMIGSQKIAP